LWWLSSRNKQSQDRLENTQGNRLVSATPVFGQRVVYPPTPGRNSARYASDCLLDTGSIYYKGVGMTFSKLINSILFIALLAIFGLGLLIAGYSPGQITVGGNSIFEIYDPRIEAQATAIAQESKDKARKSEVERQILEAERDKAKTDAEAAEQAKPALTVRNILIAVGSGLGALVIVVGGAYAAVTWLHKRAASVAPNEAGLYPLIVTKGWGYVSIHDPNRNTGSAAVYQVSTPVEQGLHILAALRHFFLTGQPPDGLALPAPQADFPQSASEHTVAQITTQAQVGQTMAALAHGARGNPKVQHQLSRKVIHHMADPSALLGIERQPRLPPVTVIPPGDFEQFKKTYVLDAEGHDL